MTRKEAIQVLKMVEAYGLANEAKRMAIDALKADRPRGKWTKATEAIWQCSLCNGIMYVESNYCPFCGAKMDRERSEE